jgi:hypothetical protein
MSDLIDRAKAISSLKPDAVWTDNNGVLSWDAGNSQSKPTEDEITAEINRLDYKNKREAEYPSVVDQLDDIYHNGIDGWKATIKTTKDKYPKP